MSFTVQHHSPLQQEGTRRYHSSSTGFVRHDSARDSILPLADVACQMASIDCYSPSSPDLHNDHQLLSNIPSRCDSQLQMLQALHKYLKPAMDEEVATQGRKRKRSSSAMRKEKEQEEDEERRKEKKAKLLFGRSASDDEHSNNKGDDSEKEYEALGLRIAEEDEEDEEDERSCMVKSPKKNRHENSCAFSGSGSKSSRSESDSVQQRRRATPFQAAYLEYAFRINPRPDATAKYHISQHINMSTQRIGIWFQNKRARMKKGKTSTVPHLVGTGSIVDHSVPPVNHLGE